MYDKRMKEMYEDYVKPPSYDENSIDKDEPLYFKLHMRIQKDLNQINGVYDGRIVEAKSDMMRRIRSIEKEYDGVVSEIERHRKKDVDMYNDRANCHIDNLISTMHINIREDEGDCSWWSMIVGIIY